MGNSDFFAYAPIYVLSKCSEMGNSIIPEKDPTLPRRNLTRICKYSQSPLPLECVVKMLRI